MNDQHAHAGYAPSDGYSTGGFDADPLFGVLPDSQQAGQAAEHGGQYDSTPWDTGAQGTAAYGVYAMPEYDTSGQWATVDAAPAGYPPQAGMWNQQDQFDPPAQSGQFEPPPTQPQQDGPAPYGYAPADRFEASPFQSTPYGYEATAQWAAPVSDSGAYDATAWNPLRDTHMAEAVVPGQFSPEQPSGHGQEQQPEQHPRAPYPPDPEPEQGPDHLAGTQTTPTVTAVPPQERRPEGPPGGNGNRGRRRTPSRRSALLTVAVPSACVMGVAGIAAASVGGLSAADEKQDDTKSLAAAADPGSVRPVAANNEMDTQLAALSADARDFGDRASRTQERIDLKARQDADRKKRADDAKRKEALRPKFVIPVTQHGLSAYFGQAGVNWMSVHTGIDFPVSYGTPVMAATDGTVRTQWNNAYGNMAIVTSPDGTETWYCHLSSTKIRSGSVKAGDVIAFSGNSGNSTGPHLHFEVRPGAGAAIDPLPWLRAHNLDPT